MSNMKYDITEIYDVLRARKENAYVCADIRHLKPINDEIGIKAGDAVILETMRRLEETCNDDDLFMRVGGDEFVIVTNSKDMAHAEDIVLKVGSNHESINVDGIDVPVETHIGAFIGLPEKLSADVVFDEIAKKMKLIHMEEIKKYNESIK